MILYKVHAAANRRGRHRIQSWTWTLRLHDGRDRVDDRLRDFHCQRGNGSIHRQPRLASCGVALHWISNGHRRSLLRRTRFDDAARGRPIRVSSRGFFALMGLFVRLDAVFGDPIGDDRRGCGGIRAIPRSVPAPHQRIELRPRPVHVSSGYALSLSTAQIVAICLIALLTWTNTRGLEYGKIVQNTFTTTKIGALAGLIVLGLILGRNNTAVHANFGSDFWSLHDLTAGALFIAICVSQTGSLFSSDAWNNITFTAGEVKNPKRNVPLSLALGTGVVIALYLVANVAYLATLPFNAIANAPSHRVATATLEVIFPGKGGILMAAFIM